MTTKRWWCWNSVLKGLKEHRSTAGWKVREKTLGTPKMKERCCRDFVYGTMEVERDLVGSLGGRGLGVWLVDMPVVVGVQLVDNL